LRVDSMYVLVSARNRRLIDSHRRRQLRPAASLHSAAHGPRADSGHLIPAESQSLGHCRDVLRRTQPVDHQRLEQRGEPRSILGARKSDLNHAVLLAFDSRHTRHRHGPVLTRIQMPPSPLDAVVARTPISALRADLRGLRSFHEDQNLAGFKSQIDPLNVPGRSDSENLFIQLSIVHPTILQTRSGGRGAVRKRERRWAEGRPFPLFHSRSTHSLS